MEGSNESRSRPFGLQMSKEIQENCKRFKFEIEDAFEEYGKKLEKLLKQVSNKDIVTIFGYTGEGKSTLMNLLINSKLVPCLHGYELSKQSSNVKIGTGFKSKTFFPNIEKINNTLFIDLPGLNDTRGQKFIIMNYLIIYNILIKSSSVRFLFITSEASFETERGVMIKKLIKKLNHLVEQEEILNNSSILVISKFKENVTKSEFLSILSTIYGDCDNFTNVLRQTFSMVLKNPKIEESEEGTESLNMLQQNKIGKTVFFYRPVKRKVKINESLDSDDDENFKFEIDETRTLKRNNKTRDEIFMLLNQLQPKKITSINRNAILDDETELKIKLTFNYLIGTLAQETYDKLKNETSIEKENIEKVFKEALFEKIGKHNLFVKFRLLDQDFFNQCYDAFDQTLILQKLSSKIKFSKLQKDLEISQKKLEEQFKKVDTFYINIIELNKSISECKSEQEKQRLLQEKEKEENKKNFEKEKLEYEEKINADIKKKIDKIISKQRENENLLEAYRKTSEFKNLMDRIMRGYQNYKELHREIKDEIEYIKRETKGNAIVKGIFSFGIHYIYHCNRPEKLRLKLGAQKKDLQKDLNIYQNIFKQKHPIHDEVV